MNDRQRVYVALFVALFAVIPILVGLGMYAVSGVENGTATEQTPTETNYSEDDPIVREIENDSECPTQQETPEKACQ